MALVLYLTLPSTGFSNIHIKFASGLSSFQYQHVHGHMQPEALWHCFSSNLRGKSSHEHPSQGKKEKKKKTNQKNKPLRSKTGKSKKSKLIFHYRNVLGYLNIFLVAQQILEKWHLANCMVLQCMCHWLTYRHYAQICKSLLHFSTRNATIWNLHLACINRDAELCWSRVSIATDLC